MTPLELTKLVWNTMVEQGFTEKYQALFFLEGSKQIEPVSLRHDCGLCDAYYGGPLKPNPNGYAPMGPCPKCPWPGAADSKCPQCCVSGSPYKAYEDAMCEVDCGGHYDKGHLLELVADCADFINALEEPE